MGKIKFTDIAGMLERDEMREITGGCGQTYGSAGGWSGGGGSSWASITGMGFGGGMSYGGSSASSSSSSSGSSYSSNSYSSNSYSNGWSNTAGGLTTNDPKAISRYFDFVYANNGVVTNAQTNAFISNEATVAGQAINNVAYSIQLNEVPVRNTYHGPSTIPQGIVINNNGMLQMNNAGGAAQNSGGSEPIPWYRRWSGDQIKAWQWYSAAGVYDDTSFNAAALYCTKNLKSSPFQDITQRNAYYDWADSKLTNASKWFGAAEIVTSWRAVGAADGVNLWYLDGAAEKFLQAGNAYLFDFNMTNAKALIETGKLTGSFVNANGNYVSFDGLTGKTLDYAMVQFEQTKVQSFINQYQKSNPSTSMNDLYKTINDSFGALFAPAEIKNVLNSNFNTSNGQKAFNFASYTDRVILGQKIIDQLYKK